MTKKIAFMAFSGYNYGSTLQSLGLFTAIKNIGYDCEVIGWREFFEKIERVRNAPHEPRNKREDQAFMQATFQNFAIRHFNFNRHLGNIPPNAKLHTSKQILLMRYSAFIGGSDQIWKPASFWFKAKRYLQFAPEAKRIAYAPSVGWDKIPLSAVGNIPQWRRWLASIPYRSCRETSGSAIVGHLVGKPVPTVVDPTFLLRPDDWRKLLKKEGVVSPEIEKILASGKPYMVAYLLDHYDIYKEYVEKLASRLSLEIVWLTGRGDMGPIQRNCALTDPAGFIKLIDGASFICADGFHGCCFSLNFSKPFCLLCAQKKNNDSRMQDLFTRFGVKGRVVFPEDDPYSLNVALDYTEIQRRIEDARKKSIDFLSESLAKASQGSGMLPILYEKFKTRLLKKFKRKKGFVRTVQRIPLDNPNNCTGCAACMNLCPKDAISMQPNQDGFLMPVVDEQKCILCGKCLNQCPLRKRPEIGPHAEVEEVYATWIKNEEMLSRSASGGMFPLLAEKTFAEGGVVYGAAWDKNDWSLHTVCASNMEEAKAIQGSKYVQAETGFVFRDIKNKLQEGTPVLFTGTSCQVGGLYAYLGGDHDLLTTVDLLCGGVPSPQTLRKYIDWREKEQGAKLIDLKFRSKEVNGWGLGMVLHFSNDKKYQFDMFEDEYGILYNLHFIQRPSCFVCHFRGAQRRLADISIGDFWGIGRHGITFEHEKSQGISVVLSNTIKGKAVIETLVADEKRVFAEKRPLSEVLPGHAWLTKNYGKRDDYDELMKLLREKNFEEAFATHFGDKTIREYLELN